MTSSCGWRFLVVVGLALGGCGDNLEPPADAPRPDASVDLVERGRYIANTLGACTFCHTPLNMDGSRDLTRLLAGVDCFFDIAPPGMGIPNDDQIGCLSTRNLTNHETGLKNASDAAIKDAIKNGMRTDGKKLTPVMPYWVFHNMTDDDLDAIVAYLRTVPGVDHAVQANQPPWSDINDNGPLATPIALSQIPMPTAGPNFESAMRGRYLSSMAGLCIDCHTPDRPFVNNMPTLFPQPVDPDKSYAGGRLFRKEDLGLVAPGFNYPATIMTRNLSPHSTGLQGWTVDQIKAAIADGKDRQGFAVCAATHGSLISPYAALEPQDLTDIANYIASLPPIDYDTGSDCMGPVVP